MLCIVSYVQLGEYFTKINTHCYDFELTECVNASSMIISGEFKTTC